jgi:septal ring factor EnvC (AmiA/AmiB activator)
MSWGKAVSILYNSFLPALTLVLAGFGWNVLAMKSLAVSTKEDAYVQFARLKGTLNWPVRGTVAVQYGTQMDPLFNLPVFRSGIHIKAAEGAPVKAVHEGKIVFADSFKGYGQLIIVNHGGGYHTLYGHLSRIFPKNGAIIKVNQPLGEVGEPAVLGTAGLYFEIRYKGKPLDPQQWLKR